MVRTEGCPGGSHGLYSSGDLSYMADAMSKDQGRALKVTRATQFLQSHGFLKDKTCPAKLASVIAAFCAFDGDVYRACVSPYGENGEKLYGASNHWKLLDNLICYHGVQLTKYSPDSGAPTTEGSELDAYIWSKLNKRVESMERWEAYTAFYKSPEWRQLRYKALVKNGRKCLACGAHGDGIVLHVDHIKPRSKYRELELDINNLQVLCEDCNIGKSNVDETDWRISSVAG